MQVKAKSIIATTSKKYTHRWVTIQSACFFFPSVQQPNLQKRNTRPHKIQTACSAQTTDAARLTFKRWGRCDGFTVGWRQRQEVHVSKLCLRFAVEAGLGEAVGLCASIGDCPDHDGEVDRQVVGPGDVQRHLDSNSFKVHCTQQQFHGMLHKVTVSTRCIAHSNSLKVYCTQ